MGLYAYLNKPVKIIGLDHVNLIEVRTSNNLYKSFKEYLFESTSECSEKEMAEKLNISIEELNIRISQQTILGEPLKVTFPIVDKQYHLGFEEIAYMGALHIKNDWYENLHNTTWVSREVVEFLMKNIFIKEEDENCFEQHIFNRFEEGKYFLKFS